MIWIVSFALLFRPALLFAVIPTASYDVQLMLMPHGHGVHGVDIVGVGVGVTMLRRSAEVGGGTPL